MPPILLIRYEPPEGEPKEYRFSSGLLTFGRDQGNDVIVPSTSVSRQHAKILPVGNHWLFCDLGSTNGSWINDESIIPQRFRIVHSGDELILADCRYTARLRTEPGFPPGRFARSLLVLENDKFQREVAMESPGLNFNIGGPEGQIKIPGMISEIVQLEFRATDAGIEAIPTEGFYLAQHNGQPLVEKKTLADGDVVELPGYLILVNDSPKTLLCDTEGDTPALGLKPAPVPPKRYDNPPQKSSSPGWQSEHRENRREPGPPRKFVFGAEGASSDGGTVVVPALQMAKVKGHGQEAAPDGFDMNFSRRMSSQLGEPEESDAKKRGRRMVYGMLFIAFALFVGLILVLLLILK